MDKEAGQQGGIAPEEKLPGRKYFNPPREELLEILGGPSSGLFGRAEQMPGTDGLKLAFERGSKGSFEELLAALGWASSWYQWRKGLWRKGEKGAKHIENIRLQRQFTSELRDLFSGTLQNPHFVNPPKARVNRKGKKIAAVAGDRYLHDNRKKIAEAVYIYLKEKEPEALADAVKWVTHYQIYLTLTVAGATALPLIGSSATSKANSAITLIDNGPREYSSCQSDFSHPQTQSILRCLHAGRDAQEAPLWLPCFDFEIPIHSRGLAILSQKLALYGAIPPIEVGLTPLDFATLKLTFDRSDASKIASEIANSAGTFTSHTIWARRGQGKSIALSQVLLRLAETAGCWTFWSVDSRRSIANDASYRSIGDLVALFRRSKVMPRKINFIIDDLHLRSGIELSAIYSLHRLAHRHGNLDGVSFSFLFSATELGQSFSENQNTIRLRLGSEDENRLYEIMTAPEPAIVGKKYESLGDLLTAHPGKNLWKDDVQSLTDFIRQHSRPLRDFRPNWFTDLDQEPGIVQHVLPIVAVAQLLDLAVPDRILRSFAAIDGENSYNKIVEFPKSRRLSHDGSWSEDDSDSWAGYALASSYYARSLLRNLHRLEPAFIEETLSKIVERSLDCAETDFLLWNATEAEFVRHVFQRAAKRKFGHLADIPAANNIAKRLFDLHGARISRLVKTRKASIDCARWAGAFSYLLPTRTSDHFLGELGFLKNTIYDLCRYSIEVGDGARTPRGFVPLMWAVRALCQTRSTEVDLNDLTQVAENLNLQVPLEIAVSKKDSAWERRANQIVLSYAKLLTALPNLAKKSAAARVTRVYDEVEYKYANQFRLDAENWLCRAGAVWIQDSRDPRVKMRAQFLWQARRAVLGQRGEQALWKARVEREIATFEADYGSMSNYVGQNSPDRVIK